MSISPATSESDAATNRGEVDARAATAAPTWREWQTARASEHRSKVAGNDKQASVKSSDSSPRSRVTLAADRRARIQRKKRIAAQQELGTGELRKAAGDAAFREEDWEMAIIQWTRALGLLGQSSSVQAGMLAELQVREQEAGTPSTASGPLKSKEAPSTSGAGGGGSGSAEDAARDRARGDGAANGGGDDTSGKKTSTTSSRDEIAVLYSNRSAAHANLGEYQDALRDAKLAIFFNDSFLRAYARKGAALFFLGRVEAARDAYIDGLVKYDELISIRAGLSPLAGTMGFGGGDGTGGARPPPSDELRLALQQGVDDCSLLLDVTGGPSTTTSTPWSRRRTWRQYVSTLVNPLQLESWNLYVMYCCLVFSLVNGFVLQVYYGAGSSSRGGWR
eukprot:g15163.t1